MSVADRHILHYDFESRSTARLELCGAWHYAGDASTRIYCAGYAVDDGPVQIWTPGQPIPTEFHEAAHDPTWLVVAHNNQFEWAIEERLLQPRYGWPLVPLERHRCSMAMTLAAALPGALENAAAALALPYQKDREGRRLMLRLARLAADAEPSAEELQRLYEYCRRDVEVERALYHRLPPLSASEQELWMLDARINARGFHVDRALAIAAQQIACSEQILINGEIAKLTNGKITTANQTARITAFVRERGHDLQNLTKHSVNTALADSPNEEVKQLLELRRDGSRASVRKISSLLAGIDDDDRLRGTLRFHGAATGRWSASHFQPQNLKKPETKDIGAAVDAILADDMPRLRALGTPMKIVGDVSRAMICAAPGHILIGGDFSAIELRVLAWISGEDWKLETYRRFDASGDPSLEPYCVTASHVLKRPVTPDDEAGRQIGKTCDLAFGYGGGLGAWRKFDRSENHSDADVERFKRDWRAAHKATVKFWHALETTMRRAIRTGQPIKLDSLTCIFENGMLYLTLPSGRRLAYPQARLAPGKFDGTTQILFKDNARGGWNDNRGWHGSFTENAVQAISRDLLAAAMQRVEVTYPVILTVHDEILCEVPEGFGSEAEFLRLILQLPDWAAGLPIAAKVWSGRRYAKPGAPAQRETQTAKTASLLPPRQVNGVKSIMVPAEEEEKAPVSDAHVPLTELIGQPLTADGNIHCPFHADSTPSLHIYPDHFHCFGCGAHGDHIDWLMMIEGMSRDEALAVLERWDGTIAPPRRVDDGEASRARALQLWQQAKPIAGTLAAQYLTEHRRIDLAALPASVDEVLRFHPNCPFGSGVRHPCLLALMRDIASDEPTGIHRIALTANGSKIDRRMLGRGGAVKLWPAGAQLIIGEGIETTLAAATRISHRGSPLRPAWSAVSSGALGKLPVVPGVERLLILVDHDLNGQGQAAAARCAERWSRAGRSVTQLKPKQAGTDFNDLIMEPAP